MKKKYNRWTEETDKPKQSKFCKHLVKSLINETGVITESQWGEYCEKTIKEVIIE